MDLPKKKGYHRHHIVPKHAGGDDSKENLVYLTPEEHALAHLELYEKYGKYEDAMAYNQLSRNVESGFSLDGYKQSEEHIRKRIESIDYEQVSKTLKERYQNQPHHSLGKKNGPPSEETKKKISEATTGKKKDNSKGLMGGARKLHDGGNYRYMCIKCKQPVSPSRINRHNKCFKE
jgi:hypothetical protein